MNPHDVIRRPILSEKSVYLQNAQNKYTFEIDPRATKTQVRAAVETLFKVKVLRVNTLNIHGERRRTRQGVGMTPSWKKAVVTVAADQKIEGI